MTINATTTSVQRPYNRLEVFWVGEHLPAIKRRLEEPQTGTLLGRLLYAPQRLGSYPGEPGARYVTQTLNIRPHQATALAEEVHGPLEPIHAGFITIPEASKNQVLKVRLYGLENRSIKEVVGVSIATNPLETPLEALDTLAERTYYDKTIDALIDIVNDHATPSDIKSYLRDARPRTTRELSDKKSAEARRYGYAVLEWYARLLLFTQTLVKDAEGSGHGTFRARQQHVPVMAGFGAGDLVRMEAVGGHAFAENGREQAVRRRTLLGKRHLEAFPEDSWYLQDEGE